MATKMTVKQIVKALEPFTSCDISDALVKLHHPHGGFLPNLTLHSPTTPHSPDSSTPTKLIGPAHTIRYVLRNSPADHDLPPPPTHHHYIDHVPASSVLFISAPPTMTNACYGGLMSARARHLGVAGVVVDGRVRDLQEHRDLGVTVFARGVGTAAPGPVARVGVVGGEVEVGGDEGVVVREGDFLFGDLNGVVCLPVECVEEAIGLLGGLVEADRRVAEEIGRGGLVWEAMEKWRRK